MGEVILNVAGDTLKRLSPWHVLVPAAALLPAVYVAAQADPPSEYVDARVCGACHRQIAVRR